MSETCETCGAKYVLDDDGFWLCECEHDPDAYAVN